MFRGLANTVFIGMRGHVLALDRNTGNEIWRTPLKSCGFVNVSLDGLDLFATTHGEIFCLDPSTGRCLWNNPLRGMGYGLICIAGASSQAPLAEEFHRQAESNSASTTAFAAQPQG
jgi:outer membrane protein assembly factor BamB